MPLIILVVYCSARRESSRVYQVKCEERTNGCMKETKEEEEEEELSSSSSSFFPCVCTYVTYMLNRLWFGAAHDTAPGHLSLRARSSSHPLCERPNNVAAWTGDERERELE